ncbi:MAG: universal stress protein [Verrucomicrobiota bacterium]
MDEALSLAFPGGGMVNRIHRRVQGFFSDGHSQVRYGGRQGATSVRPPQIMFPGRVLIPVDLTKCPLETFSCVNRFAHSHRVTVTLLHVVNLCAAVFDNRAFDLLSQRAREHIRLLAEHFLDPRLPVRLRVRVGKPAEEILAEAKEASVDWILLTTYGGGSFWKRPFRPRIVEKVFRAAPCNATLLHVRTRFNCEEDWGCVDAILSSLTCTGLFRSPEPAVA